MLSLLNKKLLTLLVSPSKPATTKLVSSYATRAPDNDQNMVMDPKEHLDKQGKRHTQSKPGKKAPKDALRSEAGLEGEISVQDRQEGNMLHDAGTEQRTPGETYNTGRQSVGQQVGGVYKDRLDFASDIPQGTAAPQHDRMVDAYGVDRPEGGTVERQNEDAVEGRTGYGEHVKPGRTGYNEQVAPTGDKQQRHTTTRKTAPHEEPLVTSFHTFTTSFHTWSRLRAPNSQQVPKKQQSPPQPTWRPGKSEPNINDDEDMLVINYRGEDQSRDKDDRLLDSTPHNTHEGVLGQDKEDARRHVEKGKPLKGQYERN